MFILFDIGGTKIRVAAANREGIIGEPMIMQTPANFDKGMELLTQTVHSFSTGEKITAMVGGVAGSFDRGHTTLVSGPNIASWIGKPIKKLFEDAFQASVYLENDAALAGLGEAVVGAGKDYEIVGYMTVSTGVGGARITNKKIDKHVFGFEPGFQIIDFDGSSCSRCSKRHLGAHISGKGVEEHYGIKGEHITDPNVWEDITRAFAVGLANTILHWSPDIMVLGGSMMKDISLDRVRELVKDYVRVYPELPAIERAALGDTGGLEGALQIARELDMV